MLTKACTYANNVEVVEPDEMTYNKPSHQDLQ